MPGRGGAEKGRTRRSFGTVSPPKEAASPERTEKLIRQLGDKDFFARQKAQDELAQMGFDAFDAP